VIEFDWSAEFGSAMDDELAELDEHGFPREQWMRGGRVSKDAPNKEDELWWRERGPQMGQAWQEWREQSKWQIWEPVPGTPAIELRISFDLGLDKPGLVIIDRVMVTPNGELVILDLKTGSSTPASSMQLGWASVAIEQTFGIKPPYGCYWKGRKGDNLPLTPLNQWTLPLFRELYRMYLRGSRSGVYIPNVDTICMTCGVRYACYLGGGEKAWELDPLASKVTLSPEVDLGEKEGSSDGNADQEGEAQVTAEKPPY
jgi:hypothetical protein